MAVRDLTITDPTFTPKEKRNALERVVLRFIRDERDIPFVALCAQMTLILIPAAMLLYVPGFFRWWMAPLYWGLLFAGFFDRYILMLHNTSHRPLWKREYGWAKYYIPWVLGPFCGETPETYYIHHIGMHHAEGNLPKDLSSTLQYQRDSALDFLRYWADFFFLSLFRLANYHGRKKRHSMVRRMLAGEFTFYLVVALGLAINAAATLTVFVVPFLLCRFLMMCGNWGQHAFVDADDAGNSYRNSITCINALYNRRCFNDGYHIGHHLVANMHWTDLPLEFQKNRAKYAEQGAIVFEGIDFFIVWFFLMTHNYKALAKHYVDLGETPKTDEEIIELLKSRVARIDVSRPEVMEAVPV